MEAKGTSVYLSLHTAKALSSKIASLLLIKVFPNSYQMDSVITAEELISLL